MAQAYLFMITLTVTLFLIDDLFIDFFALIKRIKPKPIEESVLYNQKNIKNLAIMVANWKEQDVLEAMVNGNKINLPYENVHIFLGVYPNDLETLQIALKMQEIHSRVYAVINPQNGPTYKGQMLNEIIKHIFRHEEEIGVEFDGFILHDSEDILDRRIPLLYGLGLRQADFIQTPVLSLPVKKTQITAGTYMDEFAEVHTKELLVREYLGGALPSAGVGTCLTRKLILTFLARQQGLVFLPDSLTEDYQLGLQSSMWGFHSKFLCYYEGRNSADIISTKEFFPANFWCSIRQKTRWTTGIAFQGLINIGWYGNGWQRYFLWRDRKGPINAFLILNVLIILLVAPLHLSHETLSSKLLLYLLTFNTVGMTLRFIFRGLCVYRVYGILSALTIIFRWPAAMLINMTAGLRSCQEFLISSTTGQAIKWSKTQHRLPENFGKVPEIPIQSVGININEFYYQQSEVEEKEERQRNTEVV